MSSATSRGTGSISEWCLSPFILAILLSLPLSLLLAAHAGALQQMEPGEFAQGVEYKLLMSRDDKVCTHMLALFNSDLKQFGYEKYGEHEEFKSIGWRKEKYSRMEGDRRVEGIAEVANIDINNDGTKDVVLRLTNFFGGYDTHVLYIFPNIAPTTKEWVLTEIVRSPGRISLYNWTYDLNQPPGNAPKGQSTTATPPIASGLSVLEPFFLHGVTYISMRALYELVTGSDAANEFARIHVITRYKQGKIEGGTKQRVPQAGQTEDVCYYKVRTK